MKLRLFIKSLSMLCALVLLVGLMPASAVSPTPAMGEGFPYTPADKPLLIEQILERDGLIDGIWFPWFDGGNVGHSLTGNETMVKYQGSSWSTVAMDNVGAHKIYREIYNLKAMGYNLLGYGASIYDEGVIHNEYGDVIGIKQEFLDNSRRLLNMCREIGMPVMWTVCFHSSSAPGYYGIEAYDLFAQKYCNPTVTEHYVERFVRPMCEMLAEYKDILALVAIADEPENEINDSEKGDHFNMREMYGVNLDDMVHFMSRINDVVKEELPDVARTVASNDMDKSIYGGFDLDLMGHNRYDNNANVPDVEDYKTDAPIIMTEYNVGDDLDRDPNLFTDRLIRWRENMMKKGYKGGVQWAWMSHGTHWSTAYYLLDTVSWDGSPNTDFVPSVGDLRHYIDDYRAVYRGERIVLDKPVLYCNEGGGLVEWIPSRQATKMDILRSTDGGKNWTYVLKNANQSSYVSKNKGCFIDAVVPNSMYKIVVRDDKGNTAESEPNNVAGTELKYKKNTTYVSISGPTGIGRHYNTYSRYRLYSFGELNNRPLSSAKNLLVNGSFEFAGGHLTSGNFLAAAQMVSDPTAPNGSKSLYFDATGEASGKWYTFSVPVQPYTDYVFSTWVKGGFLSSTNAGNASIGVVAPDTGKFMYCSGQNASWDTNQIYPTAWDGEWHLRSVAFNSSDMTQVTIALYGVNSHLYVDDMALFKNGDGVKYAGKRLVSSVGISHDVSYSACLPGDSLTGDVAVDGADYWQSGYGWRNGFMSIHESRVNYGYSLKYTGSEDSYGLYYIKWLDVKPHTRYIFSFDMKILEEGAGKFVLMDDCITLPVEAVAFEMDQDSFGTDWKRYSLEINPRNFERLGIGVCDLGGSCLLDNIRLFEVADGVDIKDLKTSSVKVVNNVAYGKSASVEARATGDGLKYQWYYKNKGASKFTLTTSITGKTYSVKMDKSRDGRQVYCVITDKYGTSRKTATTTLTVKRSTPKITTQPKTAYAKLNATAKTTVKATGDGLTYQWYVKNAGATKYSKSSITSATYSVKMTEKVHGRRVYCVVKDAWGKTVQSNTVLLRRAASIVTQPKTTTVAKNKIAKVTVKAAGDGLTYTWYIKNPGQSKYSKASVKSATYSCKMTAKINGRYVYCVVKDKYGKTVQTKTVRVKMK